MSRNEKAPDGSEDSGSGAVVEAIEENQKASVIEATTDKPTTQTMRQLDTDVRFADAFIGEFGDDVRYCHERKQFPIWDGCKWGWDETGRVTEFFKEIARGEYDRAWNERDDTRREAELRKAKALQSKARISPAEHFAKSDPRIVIREEQLDADPWLFNVSNGTLDLRTGTLELHRRSDYITTMSDVFYDPAVDAPVWKEFIRQITDGDNALAEYLQRLAGYFLSGSTRDEEFYLFHGIGANGKSTFIEAIRYVMGEHAMQADATTFLKSRGEKIPNDIARMKGRRLVTASEVPQGMYFNESLVKQLTGGDVIAGRFLFREYFEYLPQFKLLIATNYLPRISGSDEGIWRRPVVVPFSVSIPPEERDKELRLKLQGEASGIFNWMLEGCRRWQLGDSSKPEAVIKATAEYRLDMSPLKRYLEENCVFGHGYSANFAKLYEGYVSWCAQNGHYKLSKRNFGKSLDSFGYEPGKGTGGVRIRKGLRMRLGYP